MFACTCMKFVLWKVITIKKYQKVMTDGNILKCFHEIRLMLTPLSGVKENPYTLSLNVSLWLSLFLYPIFSSLEKAPLFLKVWMCLLFGFEYVHSPVAIWWVTVFQGYNSHPSSICTEWNRWRWTVWWSLNRNQQVKEHAYLVSSLDQLIGEL